MLKGFGKANLIKTPLVKLFSEMPNYRLLLIGVRLCRTGYFTPGREGGVVGSGGRVPPSSHFLRYRRTVNMLR